jgi:Lamin Tail Domain
MRISRRWLVVLAAAWLAAAGLQARSSSAQQPEPTATAADNPGLSLQLAQHASTDPAGNAVQEVDAVIGSNYRVQVRLIEDGATLAFDGFTDDSTSVVVRSFARVCGQRHGYDLYAVVHGAVIASRSAAIVLCAEAAPANAPSQQATATPAAVPPSAAPAAQPAAAAPAPPAPAAAPARSTTKPGEPPVPPPPLEPPSLAMTHGFVLAQPDDEEAANAAAAGVPLVRVLAIWLKGTDNSGLGNGAYQYVEVGNLGGATQVLTGWALQGDSAGISGLMFYFPDGFTLAAGDSCRVYVGHPAGNSCTDGSFALYRFWSDHGDATLWDDQNDAVDSLAY